MFTRSEVIVLTNKQTHIQTDAAENIRYATKWSNNYVLHITTAYEW